MYLIATMRTPLTDIGVDAGYITGYDVDIYVAGSEDDFRKAGLVVPGETNDQGDVYAVGGKAIVDRLHITLVEQGEDSLYDACDADSREWEAVFAAFLCEDGDRGFFKEIYETVDCCQHDVLLIRDISVSPEFQSRGLEMAVAERIIETLGSWCDLAVYNYGEHTDELERLKPIGFRPGPAVSSIEGYAFLNLNHAHPRVHPDGFCKFVALPVDDEDEYPATMPTRPDGNAWFWCVHCERIWLARGKSSSGCPWSERGQCDGSSIDVWEVGRGNELPPAHWPPVEQWQVGQKFPGYTQQGPNASA